MKSVLFSLGLGALMVASTADAATKHTNDREFSTKASQGGMAEVKLGELAQKKSSNSTVQEFAKQMVKQHSDANSKLEELAKKDNVPLPGDVSKAQKATYEKLEKLKGAEFDKKYAEIMLKDHKSTIDLFEKESDKGKNGDLKQFAAETLPTLKSHLKMTEELCKSVGAGESPRASMK